MPDPLPAPLDPKKDRTPMYPKNLNRSRSQSRFSKVFIRRLSSWLVLSTALTLGIQHGANAVTGQWTLDNSGNWTASANWAGGIVPNNIDDIAIFGNNILANRTVTLDAPITLGGLTIGDAFGTSVFTFAGANALTFDVTAGDAVINKYNSVTDVWQAPLILNDNLKANIYAGTLDVNNAGAQVSYSGAGNTIKNGAGALQLNIDATTAAYTGNWAVNLGTLRIGGANGATPGSLGTGTGGITLNGQGRADLAILDLRNNGDAVSNTDIFYTGNNDVILQGGATINVDRNYIAAGGNTGNTIVLDNLTANGGILAVTGSNSYRLRFDGTTTLVGDTTVFSVAGNATSNFANLTLAGVITDGANTRALIKEGAGRMIVSNTANTYNGVTAIKDGILQVGAGANLGSGAVFVNGGAIGLTSAAQATSTTNATFAGGLNLVSQIGATRSSLGAVVNTGFDIDAGSPLDVAVPIYGMALEVDNIANNIDIAQVGGGGAASNRVYLSNRLGFDSTYTGTLTPSANGTLRLASATNNLILSTLNSLGGAGSTANLVVGIDQANAAIFSVGLAITHGTGGTVSVRNNNDVTLGTVTVNRGVTLNVNGAGITTPLGAGVVTVLGGTVSTDATSDVRFGNTDFRLFGGSTLLLDNSAVAALNTNRRLLTTTDIDLTSSTLRLLGDGGAATVSSQAVNSIDYVGGSTLSVDTDGAIAGRLTTLTTGTLNRTVRGTLNVRNIGNQATTFGTAAGTQKLIITANPTVTNDMIGANIALWGGTTSNDGTSPLFATYNATHGVEAAVFDLSGAAVDTASELAAATAGQIVSIDLLLANMTVTSGTVQALRIRTTNNTTQSVNGGTITIGSTAAVGQGAGLFLSHTADNINTHSANFAFGSQEGLIYNSTSGGSSAVLLTGVLSGSNGVTRFGDGLLRLQGSNTFTGNLTINAGETRLNARDAGGQFAATNMIDLWGGALYFEATNQRYFNNVTFSNDARLGNVNTGGTGFGNLTVAARTGSMAPIVLDIRNQSGGNTTTAFGGLTLNGPAQAYVTHFLQVNGALSGTGTFEKFGNERFFIGGDSSAYSQAVTVNTGVVGSLNSVSTAKPFGTGAIVINPGGSLRLAAASNVDAAQITLNSDLGGISGIGMTYVGDPTALAAKIAGGSSAPGWRGFLGIGTVGFSTNINQSTLWGGNVFLGAMVGETGIYTGTLTPAAGNNFLLGTGQGTIRVAAPLTGASNNAVIGTGMTGDVSRANQNINNSGGAVQYDVPMTYGGSTIVQPNIVLRISATNAVTGIGAITLNGGTLQGDAQIGQLRLLAPLTIANAVNLTGDSGIQLQNNPSDFRITGALGLAPGSTGVVRQLFVGVDQPGAAANNAGNLYLDGGITDGVGGSGNHLIKAGPGTVMLTGTQTYTGSTTISGGLLGINSDADLASSSQIVLTGGGLGVFENSFTTTRNLSFHGGNGWFDVMGGLTLTQGASSTYDGTSFILKRGLGTLILNGNNAVTGLLVADGILQVNSLAAMGDPAAATATAIQFGGDFNIGGANNNSRFTGGSLRVNGTFATNRGLTFNNNGNTSFGGGIDVTAGNTFTVNGVISQGTEFDFGFKTGAGTLIATAANTARQMAFTNGTYQFGNSTPWLNNSATAADNTNIEMLGGTIRAVNTAATILLPVAAQTVNYNYGGGLHLRLESGATVSVEFNADNLVRVNQGTLVVETAGATTLGGVGNINTARLIATNAINSGLARASALNNGIFAAHLIGANAAGTAFFLQNNVTTGLEAYAGATVATLDAVAPTAIGDISAPQVLTGNDRSIYAFRTTADVSGGTLRIGAIDNVREGGILINGSNTISSNLIFDPTSATAPGTGTVGEGLVYVKTGENATISGTTLANAFTKFGSGSLTLSGNASVLSDLSVQEGTLMLGSNGLTTRMNSELNINAGATLDLNGSKIAVETLGANNRLVATSAVGGAVTNSSGTLSVLNVASPVTGTYTGTLGGNLRLMKEGAGVLNIDGFRASTPDAGNNTFTGGTALYGINLTGGINLDNASFGLGGSGGSTPGAVDLYSGTLGLLFSNANTGLQGGANHGQQFSNQVVKFGAEAGDGLTLNVRGPAQINVNQSTFTAQTAFGVGNIMQVGALNMSNNTLNLSGGNFYRLRVAGTTSILGAQATFQTNSDGPGGALEFAGLVTGAGAINKTGDGSMRTIIFANSGNNFSGGLNIIGGDVQNTNPSANTLGTGAVRIFPDGTLRIAGNGGVIGANLTTLSRINSMGAVALDENFNPTVLNGTNFSSIYGVTLQVAQPYWTRALNMATIGDGRAFLGTGIANDPTRYVAASLGAGLADAWNPGVGVYRIVGGVTNFAFEGVNNVFTGSSYLQVGPQRNNVLGAVGNTGNAVFIRNSNNYSGGTQIAEGTVLISEIGGSPIGETPLGTGAVEVYGEYRIQGLLGSAWKADTAAATNTINLRPGGLVRIFDTTGKFTAGDQGKWGDTVGIDLNGGQFSYGGAANWNNVETIGEVTARKGGILTVTRGLASSSAQLNVGNIDRIDQGTLTINYNNGFLGTNLTTPLSYERLTATQIDGAATLSTLTGTTTNGAGVVNGGMIAPWIIDQVTNTFVGYNPTGAGTGFQPIVSTLTPGAGEIAYNKIASGALTVGGLVAGDIADLTTAAKTLADVSTTVYALRTSQNISPTAANNTLTITSGGLIMTGGTINPLGAVTAGVVSPMTLNFGAAGAGEALIFTSAASVIQAQIRAAQGLTKFGSSSLEIRSINPDIDGAVTVNVGTLIARVPFSGTGTALPVGSGVFGGQDVILNGGALQLDPFMANAAGTATEIASSVRATAIFNSNIIVRADSSLNNNGQVQYVRIQDLTFQNGGGAAAMDGNGVIALNMQNGIWVTGTTTLIPQAVINLSFNGFAQSTFAGQITGAADFEKFGNGTATFLNATNNYSGGTLIQGTTNNTAASIVASGVRGAGTPFGSGAVTVNPGGLLRITDTANIVSNVVNLRSDGISLAGLGIAYDGALPTITTGVAAPGQVHVESTGAFAGVITLDYGYYSQALNMAAIPGGDWWLGNSGTSEAYYFNATLGAAANGKYLLGGGGSQNGVNFGSVSVGALNSRTTLFENIFTGGTANTVRVEAGALTAELFANGPSFVNGNSGGIGIALATRNTGLVGDVRVNTNTTLALGNNFALGSGRLILNGGNLRYDGIAPNNAITSQITFDNNVLLQGDWSTSGGNELVINGNVAMHDGAAGATRIWNMTGSGAMAVGLTAGSVTNGVVSGNDGSNLIKRGLQQLALRATNTYQGFTQIDRGEIVITGNVAPGVAGPLGNSNSAIILGLESTNNAGSLGIGGHYTVSRDILVTSAPGTGANIIAARTNERAIVSGGISVASGAIVTLGAAAADVVNWRGGLLDVQGGISGAGSVIIGTTGAAPGNGGTVLLSASSNGFGINTYAGGTTLNSGRLQIGSDTYFSGLATAPTILSGPLGTGTFTFAGGEANRGGTIEAVGGARTIVNALGTDTTAASTVRSFSGREALTFTRDYNIQSDGALRNRTFTTNNLYQPVTFSGNFSNSSAQGSNFLKLGAGMLILTGTNTHANLLISDGNYGTGVFLDGGILRVNADAALGSTAALPAGMAHLVGAADVRLRGGTLSITSGFTTARQFILTAASGLDVASGQTLTVSTQTAGAFGITKTGPGTLALNNGANTITTLTLGGAQQVNPNVGLFSHTGGTVSTTAVSGTPFAATSVTINSGTLSLANAAAQTLVIPTITYGAAANIAIGAGDTLTATALTRGGAFNAVNYGTLTLNPSALAALGAADKVTSTAVIANTAGAGGNILTVPSVFAALAGAGQDANFTRYIDAPNGFAQHNVTTVATLNTTAPNNVGDILAGDSVGLAPNDIVDILALRTAANIGSFDGTQLLRINNGGLIINGAAASTLSANVRFGTGAALTEAIVYVRDGQTGTSAISGNTSALDFTKTGAGTLSLSGAANTLNTNAARLPVLSIQNGTLRYATAGAQFTNANRPAAVNSVLGSYVLNVNEAGIFDLNGLATTVGGLTGNGTVTSNVGGAVNFRVANGFAVDPTFSGLISDGSGVVSVTKSGDGILTFTGHGSYTGGTTVEAGRVLNAVGSTAANGRLEAQKMTALGTGPITLAGGTLTLNATTYFSNAQTASEVQDGFEYNLWGGGSGYNITVGSSGLSQGVALPNNITSTLNAGTQNAGIGSLTINAPILTSTAGLIQVNGATTINQDTVIRTAGGRLFLAGQINAAGQTITKTGANDLVLTHTESGGGQNSVGGWKVYGGLLNPRSADGASNPLGSGVTVELNAGTTTFGLLLSTDGDGTFATERVTTYADTNIQYGSLLGVSSNQFVSSGASRLQSGRILANNDDKTVVVNNLVVGGVLGSPYVFTTSTDSDSHWVNGTTTFTRDMYLQNDARLTLNGVISGNGTFVKRGGGDLFINANNALSGYQGGTILGAGGTTYLGSMVGNQITLSNTATLGGPVIINASSRLLLNNLGNVQAGQTFTVGGNLNNYGVLGLGSNDTLEAYGYRAAGLGGIQNGPTDYYISATNPSGAVLAINTIYTQTLNLATIGNGFSYLGSTTNGVGANGSYDAATLGAGAGNTYRLGAGGATLFFGSNGNSNILTGANSVVIGLPFSVENNNVIGNVSGTIVLLGSQNYTGSTYINRNSAFDFRGTLATSGIETYGSLNVAGDNGTFIGAGAVTLRPGSTLRFDNSSGVPTAAAGRWTDSTAIALDNATVRLQGNTALEVAETVGAITTQGGSFIEIVRGVHGRGTELRTSSISRVNNGTIQFNHNNEQLGSDERLIITGAAPTVTNGMVAPWMVSNTNTEFLTYNADTGFTKAGFDSLANGGTTVATISTPTSRTLFQTAATVLGTGFDINTYASRLDQNLTLLVATSSTVGTNRLILQSGGLILNGARTVTTGLQAGAGASELVLFNNNTVNLGDNLAANRATSGQIAASSITKFGAGQLNLNSEQQTFNGNIRVQQGSLVLRYANGTESNPISNSGGVGSNIILEGPNVTLFFRGGQDNLTGNVTFNNSVTLGDYNPIVQIDADRQGGGITNRRAIINNNFTFGANNTETGQIVRYAGANAFDLQIGSDATDLLTLVGKSTFNVATSSADVFVAAKTTGTGRLIMAGGATLDLANVTNLNDYSGGTTLMSGNLTVRSKSTNVAANTNSNLTAGSLGTGAITLMSGQLNLLVDTSAVATDTDIEFVRYSAAGNGPDLFVNGAATIFTDRAVTAFDSNKMVTFNNLTIGSQILTTFSGNGYGINIAGTTNLQGNLFLNNTAEFILNGAVNDGGAGLFINKVGGGTLWVNTNNNTATSPNGGVFINAGALDFGNRATANATATIGIGDIFINPGAEILVRGIGNVNTASGQEVVLTGTPYSPSVFRAFSALTQTDFTSLIRNTSATTTSNEVVVIGFSGTPAASNFDQSTIGNGRVFFGSVSADRFINGAAGVGTLTPGLADLANNVVGSGEANRVYRLGGRNSFALVINLNTTGNLTDVGGPTNLQIGSLANLGPAANWGLGQVLLQDQNTYTGQTIVSRNSTLRFGSVSSLTAGPFGGLTAGTSAAPINVYGVLQAESGGTFRNSALTANAYTNINLHPGSTLQLVDNNATTNSNRWDDATGINLDGARLTLAAANNIDLSAETVGAITFDRGARIQTVNQGTSEILLTAASITRAAASAGAGTGRGTLVFTPSNSANLGLPSATNNAEQVNFTTNPTVAYPTSSALANLLPGFFVDGNAHRWVTYNATNGVTPVGDGAMTTMPTGAGLGTELVNITAATNMAAFQTSIYGLRGGAFTLSSPTGANNDATITLAGTGTDIGSVISSGAFVINPNLKFGASGTNEAIFYAGGGNITLNGNLTAGSVTKFGTSQLVMANDQSDAARGTGNGYQGGWFVNEGSLTLNTFGSAGNAAVGNVIVLNGNQVSTPTLFLRAQPADTLLNYTYTSGKITVVDNATIDWDPLADDRVHTIADIEIQQSGGIGNAAANGSNDAQLRVVNNRLRSILAAGQLTVTNNAILNVDATATPASFAGAGNNNTNLTNGISSGFSVASLTGSARLTKWGDGYLYIRGDSSTFSGPLVIDQGAVGAAHLNALGTGAVTINRYGVLDVLVAGFTKSATYNEGSVERWSVDGARTGTIDLGKGTLQVGADQNQTVAVTLNGGSIEGWLRTDDVTNTQIDTGVFRNLGANVSISLAGNSYVGNPYYLGANGLDSGKQTNDYRPTNESIGSGATLVVKGVISGASSLTKVGYDTVILTGANNYSGGTIVTGGTLKVGTNNALLSTGLVSTYGNGVLDLNGYNQSVGKLTNPADVVTNVSTTNNGYITNSAAVNKTLTVGAGSSGDATYRGVIQHNVSVAKTGTNVQNLTNNNTYVGPTSVTDGTLRVAASGSISGTSNAAVSNGFLTVNGTLGSAINLAPVAVTSTGVLAGAETTPGTGTVYGPVTASAGGTVQPGDPLIAGGIGKLNTGAFTATTGATLSITLGASNAGNAAPEAGTDYSQLVAPSVSLDSTIVLTLGNAATNFNQVNSIIYIVSNTGGAPVSGTFGFGLTEGSTFTQGGTDWQITYLANWGGSYATSSFVGGNDIALMAVPEPNSLAMLAGSIGMALGLQRFRRRRQSQSQS